jgi:phytoene dehydrogenase-like protein
VFSLLAATELTDGVFYPMGGFQKVTRPAGLDALKSPSTPPPPTTSIDNNHPHPSTTKPNQVRDGLLSIALSHGVQLRTNSRVRRITLDPATGRAAGVELEGGEALAANAVVTNVDVAASLGLVTPAASEEGGGGAAAGRWQHAKRRRAKLEAAEYRCLGGWFYTCSLLPACTNPSTPNALPLNHRPPPPIQTPSAGVIAFNWAVPAASLGPLVHHNVFLSGDFATSWRRARSPSELLTNPNFYVHVPSMTDASAAPAGCHSVMVLLPVANIQERSGDDDYSDLVAAGRAAVLRTLCAAGAPDLARPGAILHETVIAPPEWRERYGLTAGAAFGLSHGLDQLSLLRPGPEDGKLPGLYFVGASARPGNGVPLVMMGADMAVGRVMRGLGLAEG